MTTISDNESATIERRIADVEARTGVQIVTAIVPRADSYPELPWRGFALGCALAALIAVAIHVGRPDWLSTKALLMQALAILGGGFIGGALAIWFPPFAKLLLPAERARVEVRQCAETLFLTRELFATPRRDALLILVGEFERRIVIVPDVYCRGRVSTAEWQGVVAQMTPKLADGRVADAFLAGLTALERLLIDRGFTPAPPVANVIPDAMLRDEAR
ncbi:MAG TPA: hypothetical protein VNE58_06500 [Casimicrobiaceae bacterium]|nr:hypothetical protein [Casimicrobiaceae bacterium]